MAYPSRNLQAEADMRARQPLHPAQHHPGQALYHDPHSSTQARGFIQPLKMSVSPVKSMPSTADHPRPSPRSKDQKQVTFELLLPVTQSRARLPMRVMINKHDTTDSIITTVKNFYGLYDGPGVSFHDQDGNILIAAYENFYHGMTVSVKVPDSVVLPADEVLPSTAGSPKKPKLGAPFEMRPPMGNGRGLVSNRSRSASPVSINGANGKSRARSLKSQDPSGPDHADGFSDSDGGNGSVASSRRSKIEAHVSAEISVENIVEGGRRKRAKFESSELPLFVPPQVPVANSISSVSPQRRATNGDMASPVPFSNQRSFFYNQALPSPQSYGRSDTFNGAGGTPGVYGSNITFNGPPSLRGRPAVSYAPRRMTGGILPTPEPTVGSVISDEDVAIQLMRLGDANSLAHGRTSTSTADDTLSGKAELASSEEGSDDEEELALPAPRYPITDSHGAGPKRKKQRTDAIHSDSADSSGDEYNNDESFKGDSDQIMPSDDNGQGQRRLSKNVLPKPRRPSSINGARPKSSKVKGDKVGASPASGAPSRKASLGSVVQQLAADEEDLSAKPRCQRCRKSKKGCDRQRPCGRCKDAGIDASGCVSEDEGNGRRGRFGRHMGVTIKKDLEHGESPETGRSYPTTPIVAPSLAPLPPGTFLTPSLPSDASKKRKRPA